MNASRVAAASVVVHKAIEDGRTPAGIAAALDAEGRLVGAHQDAELARLEEQVPELTDRVAELEAELDQRSDDVTGACLARWAEEQDSARLRLALLSAQSGRRTLRAQVAELEARIAKVETALAATGHALSSFIFDSDDPGLDALGAQWLCWQVMPLDNDPFAQPRAFRASVFEEAARAAEALDVDWPDGHRERPQAYIGGYSDGVQAAAERLEKLADQAAEGREPTPGGAS